MLGGALCPPDPGPVRHVGRPPATCTGCGAILNAVQEDGGLWSVCSPGRGPGWVLSGYSEMAGEVCPRGVSSLGSSGAPHQARRVRTPRSGPSWLSLRASVVTLCWACLGRRAGCVHPEPVCPAPPARRGLVSGWANRQDTDLLFIRACPVHLWLPQPKKGGRWGMPALRGLRPRSRLLYWGLVAHRTGLLASEDFPISRGVGRQLTLRRWVGGHSEVGRIPHFSTKEGEREKKWVTRAQSLAEVGAEQGLARRGSLGGSSTETCLSGAPQVSAGCSLVSSAPRLSQGSSLWHVPRHLRLAFPKEA